jgi:hypothetical protein
VAARRKKSPAVRRPDPSDVVLPARPKKVPFAFVLDELDQLEPRTNPMFGSLGVYVGEKIVLILRERGKDEDDGVWIATTAEHHDSLREELPAMQSIAVFGDKVTGWQVLRASHPDFEEQVLRCCEFIRDRDPRIGKVPKGKKRPSASRDAKS